MAYRRDLRTFTEITEKTTKKHYIDEINDEKDQF